MVLIPTPAVIYSKGSSTSTLTFAPATNASGAAVITVTLNDGGASNNLTSQNFIVTVIAVNDPPTISAFANQTIVEDTPTGAISFTIGDVETLAASLAVSANSSNSALVPNGNIIFGGSGSNRTVMVTPATNQSGTATITVTVSDGEASATASFALTVTASNDAPTLSSIPNQTISQGSSISLPVAVGDAETPAGSLTLTGSSSNPGLIANSNIVFGGSGPDRTATLTSPISQAGTATITITVSGPRGSESSPMVISPFGSNFDGIAATRPRGGYTVSAQTESGVFTIKLRKADAGDPTDIR